MRVAIAGLCFLLAAVPAAALSRSQQGAKLFDSSGCRHCHTIAGVGGHMGPDLSAVGRRVKKKAILKQIEDGGQQMPPFHDVLEQNDIKSLVAYLHSLRGKPGK